MIAKCGKSAPLTLADIGLTDDHYGTQFSIDQPTKGDGKLRDALEMLGGI